MILNYQEKNNFFCNYLIKFKFCIYFLILLIFVCVEYTLCLVVKNTQNKKC